MYKVASGNPTRKPLRNRLLEFVEQPLFTLPVGIIGGLLGLFYAPVFVVCGACVVLAFHRARVVAGESLLKVQLPAYIVLCIIVVGSLYSLRVQIDRKLADANMSLSQLVASAVVKILPKSEPKSESSSAPLTRPRASAAAPQFAVLEGSSFESDDYDGTMLWESMGVGKPTISPIGLAEYFTITNTNPRASMAMIDKVEVDLKDRKRGWIELPRVLNIGPTYFGLRRDPTRISVVQFMDGFLFDKLNHKNLSPGEAVQGWVLLELPNDLSDYPRIYRIRIKNTGGNLESIKEFEHKRLAHSNGPSGTQLVPYGEPGSLGTTGVRIDSAPAGTDLSTFYVLRHSWPQR